MIEPIQVIMIIFAGFALSRAILRYKDNKITRLEFLFWTTIWGGLIYVSFIPRVITILSSLLGVGRGLDLAFLLGMICLFYLIFRAYVKIEMIDQEFTQLVSKNAIQQTKNK